MSRFLRQMTALSKKPSDFKPPEKQSAEPESKMSTVDSMSTVDNMTTVVDSQTTVDKQTTVVKVPTVDKIATAAVKGTAAVDISGNPVNPALCKPASLVQHAHTPGEHAVYMALWNL